MLDQDGVRRAVILSLLAFGLVGTVVWYETTRVYRAYIPFADIASLRTQTVELPFPLSKRFSESYVNTAILPGDVHLRIKHVHDPNVVLNMTNSNEAELNEKVKEIVEGALSDVENVVRGNIEVTLSVFLDSGCRPIKGWAISEALETYMPSILERPEIIISTQIQHFADSPAVKPKLPGTFRDAYITLEESDLENFVNLDEWNLEDSMVPHATHLNFLVYISSAKLRIGNTNGFTIPGWGGVVVIYEEDANIAPSGRFEGKPLLDVLSVTFQQVRQELGVPDRPRLIRESPYWEKASYELRVAASHALACVRTLESFAKLVNNHTNVVISDRISKLVESSLRAFGRGDYSEAYRLAQQAYFDDTMVAIMYFPDEHKLAIYTPLFFPTVVPLVVAVIGEYYRIRHSRKRGKQKDE